MPDATFLLTITPLPLVSLMVWILLGFIAMYLARRPFHQAVDALARLIYYNMCLAATSIRTNRQPRELCFSDVDLAIDRDEVGWQTGRGRRKDALALTPFFISGLVLGLFAIGAMVNFSLIAMPMADIVGANNTVAGLKTSDVAGIFLIGLHIVLGIFLMDTVRVTRLIGVTGRLDRKHRLGLFLGLLIMLTALAGVESSLAFMRSHILVDIQRQRLAGMDASSMATSNLPGIIQMILAFLLPYVLATTAIPIQAFIRSSTTTIGVVSVWALLGLTWVLRLTGSLCYYGASVVVRLYDLIIFPAIWLENRVLLRLETVKGGLPSVGKRPVDNHTPLNMVKETVACEKTAD
jgi:hypothetical protein